jgi:tetratricopeptide (TPR) repeat protein
VYHSENFIVYSDVPEGAVLRTIEEFEIFRKIVVLMLNISDPADGDPIKIILLNRLRDFNRLAGNTEAESFSYHGEFGPRMVIGPQFMEDAKQSLQYLYVQILLDRHFEVNFPTWYRVGISTLLGNTEIGNRLIVVGRFPDYYARYWRPAPLSDVIGLDYNEWVSSYYQTAWLMVHHFLIDTSDDPTLAKQTADYIRRYDAGEDPVEAFVESYRMSVADMRRKLNLAFPSGLNTITLEGFEYTGELRRRPLDPGEEFYVLGDIAVERRQHRSAHDYFDNFERLETDSLLAAKVKSRRAIALIHDARSDEGDGIIDELLALGTEDPDIFADIAHYAFHRHAYAHGDADLLNADHLDRAIEYGARSVAENPLDLEALYYLGLAYELNGDLQRSADTLLQFYDIYSSFRPLNLMLARILIKGRQTELASDLISREYSATDSEETRAKLREIQRRIEDRDSAIAAIDELL